MGTERVWRVKIFQLNMWGGRLEPQIRNLLEQEKPDVLCLQEAISFDSSRDSGFFMTMENIQDRLDLPYMVFAPVFSFKYMNGTAGFGNCILSRVPILRSEVTFTHLEHKEDFIFGVDSSNVRNFIHVVLDHNDGLNVLTHHGFHVPNHKDGTEETIEQMSQLSAYVAELDGPVVLTGDFNLAPHSKSLAKLNKQLVNLPIKHKLKTTRTPLTHKTEVCDYIFVSDDINVKSFRMYDEVVSDHAALVAEI